MSVARSVRAVTTLRLTEMKQRGEKIAMLTSYDYSTAKIVDAAGVDVILVGDSAANVMAGYETTLPITLDMMIYHARSVVRGVNRALVVVDLPFGTYQGNSKVALDSAIRIMKETGDRDGFIPPPQVYFDTMMDALGDKARLYMAFWEDQPIAGTLAIHYGNKVWYLYGASANEHRNVMPNYQLQWGMIKWSLETKCDIYDLRGVPGDLTPDTPLYGLYLFKKGFSGDLCEFCGEFEMVYKPAVDLILNKGLSAARELRRKIIVGRKRKAAEKENKPVERAPVQTQENDKPAEEK